MRVLHVLDHSPPLQSGYAVRSAAILRALNARGIDTVQLTGPKHSREEGVQTTVDGITYVRAPAVEGAGPAAQMKCVQLTRRLVRQLVARERPDLIHAHSPCLNGLAALGAGVPVIYEMRSSWEDAAVSSRKTAEGSARYRLSRALETFTVRRADATVVICRGLADELLRRGVPNEHVHVVGNAIDTDRLAPAPPGSVECLRARFSLGKRVVLGFFGSFFAWEGLDVLMRALPAIVARGHDVVLLLVGGGEQEDALRGLVAEVGMDHRVRFVGRVAHDDVCAFYALADVMVFPRRRMRLTEMVTPLKPIEAMYLGAVVAASDVGGHRELIESDVTGYLFPADDPAALADTVSRVLSERARWPDLRAAARRYVTNERTWARMAQLYERLYAALLEG
jgi:PEP-CTERM/exosortase A-associated glycosyltransferase